MVHKPEVLACCFLWLSCAFAAANPVGVVVEEVAAGGAASRAGVEAGDVLRTWTCAPGSGGESGGVLESPFVFVLVEIQQAPLCPVILKGARNGEARVFEVPPGEWLLQVSPVMSDEVWASNEGAREAQNRGEVGHSVSGLEAAAAQARATGQPEIAMWLLHRAAMVLAKADRPEQAGQARGKAHEAAVGLGGSSLLHLLVLESLGLTEAERFSQAKQVLDEARILAAKQASGTLLEAWVLAERGGAARRLALLDEAEQDHTQALALREELAPGSMEVAASFNGLANVAFVKGDFDRAAELYRRSSDLRNTIAPASLEASASWSNLGNLALMVGDLDGAEAAIRRSIAITEEIAPGTVRIGLGLNFLGIIAGDRGDLQAAERFYNQALALYVEHAPGSFDHGSVLMNLGVVAGERGDFEAAEVYFRKNLAILEKVVPGSIEVAGVLNNLGLVAMERGNLEEAEAFHHQSLEITKAANPVSPDVASSYENLGFVTLLKGDLDGAEAMLKRSLAINRELAPDSLWEAGSHTNLGKVAELRGDLDGAEASYRKALEILLRLAPVSLQIAGVLWDLGEIAAQRGDLEAAEALHQEGLGLRRNLAPGRVEEADSLNALGRVHRQMGKDDAVGLLGEAVDLLEAQEGRVGGSAEERATFRARRHGYYWDSLDLLVEQGELDRAYGVLERSRAQVLLDMMATRDLGFSADIPAELDRERRLADATFQRLQEELLLIPADETEAFEFFSAELRRVRKDRDHIRDRIRRESPRFAALSYPEPLDGNAARQAVEPGTVVLAYSVGEHRCHLFVMEHGRPVRVETIDVGREELADMVRIFRGLVENPGGGDSLEIVQMAADRLFATLIAPASGAIASADRVLIVADGSLHLLPFAALGTTTENGWKYLVELRPVSTVASLTLAKQLSSRRRDDPVANAVVFADPDYGPSGNEMPAARRGASELTALPATRVEAAAIAELYGDGVTVWLGDEATEGRARAVGAGPDLLHFAAHVEVDGVFPLESAVYLSAPRGSAREDGVLRAWEVFESCRIDADLVTLSGCQTALGREIAGEGLVGLTRAFQYAGARTVLASLWRVEDETTAELMRRFYSSLHGGASTDEALRRAQIDFIAAPIVVPDAGDGVFDHIGRWVKGLLGGSDGRKVDASHPFYWAAFRLEGDWR